MQTIPGVPDSAVARDLGVTRQTVAAWRRNQNKAGLVNVLRQAYAAEAKVFSSHEGYAYGRALAEMMRLYGMPRAQMVNEIRTNQDRKQQFNEEYEKAKASFCEYVGLANIAGLAGGVA